MRHPVLLIAIPLGLAILAGAPSRAQKPAPADSAAARKTQTGDSKPATKPRTEVTTARPKDVDPQARRRMALEFAETHHAEVARLLVNLEDRNPKEFDRAVRQLYLVAERLERLRPRDPERYELQLERWKLDSRLQLLTARFAMDRDEALRERIRELVAQRAENELRQYEFERTRLEERLSRIEAGIERIDSDRDDYVDRETKRIVNSVLQSPRGGGDKSKGPDRSKAASTTTKTPANTTPAKRAD